MSAARFRLAALLGALLAGTVLLGATAATAQQPDWKVQRLGNGITLHVGTARIAGALVEVEVARAEAGSAQIRILTPRSAFEQRDTKATQLKALRGVRRRLGDA